MHQIYGIIYRATTPSKKLYIGLTTQKLNKRVSTHLNKSKIKKYPFHRAISKYGISNILFEEIDSAYSKEELIKKEKYWIDYYKSNNRKYGYNLTKGGESFSGKDNPMHGKHFFKIWIAKYGEEKANEMLKKARYKVSRSLFKTLLNNPEINKKKANLESKNGMFGKSFHSIWLEKYGKEEANIRLLAFREKCSNRKYKPRKKRKPLFQSWIEKYGEQQGNKKILEYKKLKTGFQQGQTNIASGISFKQKLINKYGEIKGNAKYIEWRNKLNINAKNRKPLFEFWTEKYGKEEADKKIEQYKKLKNKYKKAT